MLIPRTHDFLLEKVENKIYLPYLQIRFRVSWSSDSLPAQMMLFEYKSKSSPFFWSIDSTAQPVSLAITTPAQ